MDKQSLKASISHFDRCEKYRVEKTLRRGNIETTEVVYQIAADGSQLGPFVRKRFSDSEHWDLYKRIHDAQINGLREPALPRIHEVGEDPLGYYSIIEYVKGTNLREAKARDTLAVFEDVCSAVKVLHESFDPPIIHRDIKPDNVIAVPNGVVLIDFGAARVYDEGKDRDTRPYATRAYAPPEQFGYAQTDERSDIYSLGMLLAYLETGKDPDLELRQAINAGDSALIEMGVSSPAAKTIARACAFDPKLRFDSIASMLDFLHAEMGRSYFPPAEDSLVATDESAPGLSSNTRTESPNGAQSLANMVSKWRSRWNEGAFRSLGIAWDIALLVVWAFFLVVAIWMCFDSDPDLAHIPTWLRVVEYVGVVMSLLTVCLALLLDWRPVRSIRILAWAKRRYVVVPMMAIFVICLLVTKIATS